jgi:hypothetical protein
LGEPAVADYSLAGCDSVASSDQLLYVPTDGLPLVRWSLGSQRLAGQAEVRVEDPSRYYESFLRNCEDLEEGPLVEMLGRLIGSVAERWMAQRGGGVPINSPALEDELSTVAAASLACVGLKLMSLHRETHGFVLRS